MGGFHRRGIWCAYNAPRRRRGQRKGWGGGDRGETIGFPYVMTRHIALYFTSSASSVVLAQIFCKIARTLSQMVLRVSGASRRNFLCSAAGARHLHTLPSNEINTACVETRQNINVYIIEYNILYIRSITFYFFLQ